MPGNDTMYETRPPDPALVRAAEATAKLKDEIDQLWNDAVTAHDELVSDRLVAVSHAIHRVVHLLDDRQLIG